MSRRLIDWRGDAGLAWWWVEDGEGNIWYTGNTGGLIGKLDPKTGTVTEFPLPDPKATDHPSGHRRLDGRRNVERAARGIEAEGCVG